jgi:hypothetical protein
MQFRVVRLSGWRAVVAVLFGLAVLAAVAALLALSFLVVLPVLLVAAIAYRFLPRPTMRPMDRPGEADVIEGTYEVAPDDRERKRLES